ncbi:hypothetical protein R1sor_000520 [Riccia sorocarpa]|uniref:U-box domain-containing protein n=1 Tax=Riccia sorocarpa TaxID=122646 RepID=A0ABD3GTM1_9MARC
MQVMATVEQLQSSALSSSPRSNHDDSSDSSESMEDFIYDPLTKEIMVDPVKGSDGYTYDRWTIINKALLVSPFTREPLSIVCDDINLRRWLFAKFRAEKLEQKFLEMREEYRRTTLDLVQDGQDGEALERLEHVLKWPRQDSEFAAGSSFTAQPDDVEVVAVKSSVGPDGGAAGESSTSQNSATFLLGSWSQVSSLSSTEGIASPPPSIKAAVQPDSLPPQDGESGAKASESPRTPETKARKVLGEVGSYSGTQHAEMPDSVVASVISGVSEEVLGTKQPLLDFLAQTMPLLDFLAHTKLSQNRT